MQYIAELDQYQESHQTVVTLGKFDGMHKGHMKLINRVREYSERSEAKSLVVTFDMKLRSEKDDTNREGGVSRAILMSNQERFWYLEELVDYLVVCPFTRSISQMKAEDFIKNILVKQLYASHIVVGADFRFGHGKEGDARMLSRFSDIYGYTLDIIEKEEHDGHVISSTYIKQELEKGNLELTNILLGYPYTVVGQVEHGRKLGRTLGAPTMNVKPSPQKLLPPYGVYASRIMVDGIWYFGISNVGVKPTVQEKSEVRVESFLFDYGKEAYGKEIVVQFLGFIRSEKRFSGVEELKEQIQKDIRKARLWREQIHDKFIYRNKDWILY